MADNFEFDEGHLYEGDPPADEYLAHTFLPQHTDPESSPPIDSYFGQGYDGLCIDPPWSPQGFGAGAADFPQLQSISPIPHAIADSPAFNPSQLVNGPSHTSTQRPPRLLPLAPMDSTMGRNVSPSAAPIASATRSRYNAERRQQVADNRRLGNCIFHVVKKTRVSSGDFSADGFSPSAV